MPDPIVSQSLDLKQVVNTNKCLVHTDAFDNKLLVSSCIENLLKGSVGKAVQNMNLMFGLDERTGLGLKASAFWRIKSLELRIKSYSRFAAIKNSGSTRFRVGKLLKFRCFLLNAEAQSYRD